MNGSAVLHQRAILFACLVKRGWRKGVARVQERRGFVACLLVMVNHGNERYGRVGDKSMHSVVWYGDEFHLSCASHR